MKFSINKEKCNSALGIAIAFFVLNGYTVFIPLNLCGKYKDFKMKFNSMEKIKC